MKLSLLVLTPGKNEGQVIPIRVSPFLVGRSARCHLRPASPLISQRHCALRMHGGRAFVCDHHSAHGTFVNDLPVQGERELHPRDRLRVGPLAFEVRLEAGTPVDRPTALPPAQGGPGSAAVEDAAATLLLDLPDAGRAAGGSTHPASEGVPAALPVDPPPPARVTGGNVPAQGDAASVAKALLKGYRRR
jgi:predicted component of type VI protein secretion system